MERRTIRFTSAADEIYSDDENGPSKYSGSMGDLPDYWPTPPQQEEMGEEEWQDGSAVRPAVESVRNGTNESLSAFLIGQVVAKPNAEVLKERRRRLHHADDHFRMMHLLKHNKLALSLGCIITSLAFLTVGTAMEGSAWYQEVPVSLPGRSIRHRFPQMPGWIGPRFRFVNGRDSPLDHYSECSYDTIRSEAEELLKRNKVFRRLVQEAGCRDENRIHCWKVEHKDKCGAADAEASAKCPVACGACPQLGDVSQDKKLIHVICDFRHALVERLHGIFNVVLLSMLLMICSGLLLLCYKFKKPVVALVAVMQLLATGALCYVFMEISDTALPAEDYLKLLRALNEELPTGDPYIDAWCKVTQVMLGPDGKGIQASEQGLTLLMSACIAMIIATLSTIGWFGQINGFGDLLALTWFLLLFMKSVGYIIFYLPLLCLWRCWGSFCGSCKSNWEPEAWSGDYKALGRKETHCFGVPLHPSLARLIADFRSIVQHFLRTLEWDGFLYDAPVASEVETERMLQEGITNINVQNYLAWRRSVLVVIVTMGVLYFPWSPRKVMQSLTIYREGDGLRATPSTFAEYVLHEQFQAMRDGGSGEAASTIVSQLAPAAAQFRSLGELALESAYTEELIALSHYMEQAAAVEQGFDMSWATHEHSFRGASEPDAIMLHARGSQLQANNATAGGDKDTALFLRYLSAQATKAATLLQLGMQKVAVYENAIIGVTEMTALAGALIAHAAWMHLPTSRAWIYFSWLTLIFSPFVITFVPASLFIDSMEVDILLATVIKEALEFFSIDAVVRECWTTVGSTFQTVHSLQNLADTVCRITEKMGSIGRFIFGLGNLRETCQDYRIIEKKIDMEVAEQYVGKVCVALTTVVYGDNSQFQVQNDTAFSKNQAISSQYFNEVKLRVTELFKGLVSMQFAALKILALIPSVLSMCPALIMAAYKFRLLMPLVPMPVIFMVGLPVINCPLAWTKFCLLWQLWPTPNVLLGMFIMSFGMLAWPVQSVMYRMHEPMSRPHLNRNMKKIMAVQMLFMVLSPVFLGIAFGSWILEEDDPHAIRAAVWDGIKAIPQAPPIEALVTFLLKFIFNLWMSKVAAYDYIVQQVTAEHEFATSVEKMHDFRQKMGTRFTGSPLTTQQSVIREDDEKADALRQKMQMIDAILNLVHESTTCMDQLVELESHSDVSTFLE